MVKSTGCSNKGPRFYSQPLHGPYNHLQIQFQGIQCPRLASKGTRYTNVSGGETLVLVRISVAVERHDDHNSSCKGQRLMGVAAYGVQADMVLGRQQEVVCLTGWYIEHM